MDVLNVALAKGRLADKAMEFFKISGVNCPEFDDPKRKLILTDESGKIRFFLGKPSDIPTFVEYGAADIGIVGKDTLLEEERDLFEVLDLDFAACRMCVAGPVENKDTWEENKRKKVATKYPHIAEKFPRTASGTRGDHQDQRFRGTRTHHRVGRCDRGYRAERCHPGCQRIGDLRRCGDRYFRPYGSEQGQHENKK